MVNRIKLINAGFRALRTSAPVQRMIENAAQRVARAAGDGFTVEDPGTKSRARRVVVPETVAAARQTAADPHRLISAMDAARNV